MKKTVVSIGMLLLVSGLAIGQEEKDSLRNFRLEEVVISATRSPEIIKKTASSVTVITRKEIEQQIMIAPDLSTMLGNTVPGFAFGNNQMGNRGQTLRGRSVLVMIDGIPQSSPLRANSREIRTIDPSVIERIEVIKGATSIYGNGAEGGIVNYITRKSKTKKPFGGDTVLGYTSHELFNTKMFKSTGGAGIRIAQNFYGKIGTFDYLINGTLTRNGVKLDGEGLIQNPRYGLGETDVWNAMVRLGYQSDVESKFELMYNFYSCLQDSKYVLDIGKYGEKPSTGKLGTRPGVDEGTRYNHNGYLKFTRDNIFKNSNLSATAYFQDFFTIYDYRNPPRWKTGGQATIVEKKYGIRTDFNTDFKKEGLSKVSLNYGLDLLNERTAQPLVDGRIWVPELNMLAAAPFLQGRIYMTNDFTLKAGVRWDKMRVKVPDYNTLPTNIQKDKMVAVKGGTLEYTNLSYNAGISYTAMDLFQPFASYSKGFNIYDMGRILRTATSSLLSEINTKPVVVNSYEVGFNSKVSDWLDFSASYFYNHSKLGADLVSEDGFWVPLRAPQYIQGVEFMTNLYLLQNLNLGVNYTYQDGKVDVNNDNSYEKYLSGLRIAPARLNSHLKWNTVNKKLQLGLYHIYSFERKRFLPVKGKYNEGEGPVEAFNLFNFQGNYALNKRIVFGLGIENVLNSTYYTPTSMYLARDQEYVRGNGRYCTFSLKYRY